MLTQEQLTMMAENVARIRENMAGGLPLRVKPAATRQIFCCAPPARPAPWKR